MNTGGVNKLYVFSSKGWELVYDATDIKITVDPLEKPINDIDFEEIESTILNDQRCSGHECFFNRTGVRCITCKNQENEN